MVSEFKKYRRKHIAELRPYVPGEDLSGVSISAPDKEGGSPKVGDMIARNPKNHKDQWLVAEQYFKDNFEPIEAATAPPAQASEQAAPSDEHVSVVGMPEFDALLDHIYEHGTTSEGVRSRADALARALLSRYGRLADDAQPDVHEFVQNYEFYAPDEGIAHTPTDDERAMLEDAINSYVAALKVQEGE